MLRAGRNSGSTPNFRIRADLWGHLCQLRVCFHAAAARLGSTPWA